MIGERKMKRNSLRACLSCNSVFSHLPHFSDALGTNRRSAHRRLAMKSSILKRSRIAAMLFLAILMVAGLADRSQAAGFQGGVPWQVGDVIVCFGSGTCRALRINGSTVTLLDQFSDGLLCDNHGVAINHTLHGAVTDNGGSSGATVV